MKDFYMDHCMNTNNALIAAKKVKKTKQSFTNSIKSDLYGVLPQSGCACDCV